MEITTPIYEAATRLFLRYGLKSVSMDDIAAEAGVSKKTLYQAIPSKAELIDIIVESHICTETAMIEELRDQSTTAVEEMMSISALVSETLRSMSPTLMFDMHKYYRKSWEKINTLHRGHIYNVVLMNIQRGVQEGYYRLDFDPAIIARLYVVKAMSLIDEHLFPTAECEKGGLMRTLILYHLHGILTEKGRIHLQNLSL